MQHPQVIVLAGGIGSRFYPFVTNKAIWPFMSRPFVYYTLDSLASAGIKHAHVITNAANTSIIQSYIHPTLHINVHIQPDAKGMDDAVAQLREKLKGHSLVVINGVDLVESRLFQDFFGYIQTHNPKLLCAGFHTDELLPLGYYTLSSRNTVTATIEKPTLAQKPSNVARLTCDYFQNASEFLELCDKYENIDAKDARYELAQSDLLAKYESELVLYTGQWNKLKYPHHVLSITTQLLSTINASHQGYIHPTAVLEGVVTVAPGARIEAYAVIKGPAYIGPHTIIGNHCLVRQSIIEENCVIGYGTEVARSYIGPRCHTHHAFIGDTVLESDVNMSWGTVTANMRLDGSPVMLTHPSSPERIDTNRQKLGALIAAHAFLGVNVQTMPGCIIPKSARVPPNQTVRSLYQITK
jgi:NDP-sugar pyrophosphorylase family protein